LSTLDKLLVLAHLLAAFWYVAGLVSVQISLIRASQPKDTATRAESFNEAEHYHGVLMVPGAIAGIASGLALWSQLDYNIFRTGWLIALEAMYVVTLLVCLPLIGTGMRRARLASLQAHKRGKVTPELEAAMADQVPLLFGGLATLLLPAMAALSVFRPF